jgi:hypothetical protein
MYTTPVEQISDGNGDPISGAKKFLFSVGTTTKKTIYSDSALKIGRANPVLSDAEGRFPQFFLSGLYDEEQQDNTGTATGYDGATIWGPVPVGTVAEGALTLWATDNTYEIPEIVLGSDDAYYRSLTDSNTGNDPISSAGSWEKLQFGRVWNSTVTYAKNDSVYGSDGMLYISTSAANLANNPPISSSKWRPATNQNQSAIGAGTADAITAVMPIPLQALNDEQMVTIRATAANATTTPTFAPDGLTAKTITKNGNQALLAGDIFGTGHELQLKYSLANGVWELLNPATSNPLAYPRITTLDTPEIIAPSPLTVSAWTPVNSTTLNTAGATKAILRVAALDTKPAATSLVVNFYIRKTGSALGIGNITRVAGAAQQASSAISLVVNPATEFTVNLDANSDFDYYYSTDGSVSAEIILVGYYV